MAAILSQEEINSLLSVADDVDVLDVLTRIQELTNLCKQKEITGTVEDPYVRFSLCEVNYLTESLNTLIKLCKKDNNV